jgi:hypothetical protein
VGLVAGGAEDTGALLVKGGADGAGDVLTARIAAGPVEWLLCPLPTLNAAMTPATTAIATSAAIADRNRACARVRRRC